VAVRRIALVVAACACAAFAAPAEAAPDCSPLPASRTIIQTGDVLENVYMDARQRLFYSDETANALMRLDRLDAKPRLLTDISSPGGITPLPNGDLIVGYGDSASGGPTGDQNPQAGLYRVNPNTGARTTYATGLGMANGVTRGPDGTIYATNDFGNFVDRVKGGHVTHPWAQLFSTNGIVVSPDNRYVYVDRTFVPAEIDRISVAHPDQVTPYVVAGSADTSAGLDSMTQDQHGNLYAAANGGGEVWKIDTKRRICVLARGLLNASAVAFGTGRYARNLYVTTFMGPIVELKSVRAKPAAKPSSRHERVSGRRRRQLEGSGRRSPR
jgi:sugar lactone lactonase YvrE